MVFRLATETGGDIGLLRDFLRGFRVSPDGDGFLVSRTLHRGTSARAGPTAYLSNLSL